jgi:hypothetical protein
MGKGDLVTFPSGMFCTWRIRKKCQKALTFGWLKGRLPEPFSPCSHERETGDVYSRRNIIPPGENGLRWSKKTHYGRCNDYEYLLGGRR